ncbi:hypothetical protein HanRHA438_Chr17g0789291 [Helianthus annuus]|nr:hypothetical protein HanRHA438_Chr17g0789291 [Helianthus annuus]
MCVCVCKLKKVMNKLLFYICVSKKNLKLKKINNMIWVCHFLCLQQFSVL